MPSLAEDLLHEWHFLDQKSWNHKNLWQETAELVDPVRANVVKSFTQGAKQTGRIFDSTGIDALEKMISAVVQALFPPVWFRLKMRQAELNELPNVRFWLEDTSHRMQQAFLQSNFRKVRRQKVRSILTYGCGSSFMQERQLRHGEREPKSFRGFEFQMTPVGHFAVTEDESHRLMSHYRRTFVIPLAMEQRWGRENLSDDMQRLLRENSTRRYEEFEVLHVVKPGTNRTMPWDSFWVDMRAKHLLNEKRFFEMPYFFPRYDQAAHEVMGRGPTQTAIPEIATANRARQLKLRQWGLTVNPPLQTLSDGIIGKTKMIPGGLNTVRVMDAIKPIDVGANFDHNSIPEVESKQQIRQMFLTDQLIQFAPTAKTPATATEWMQRLKFLQQLLGTPVSSMQDEWLTPMIDRGFNMMMRAGSFLPVPQELMQSDGNLDIEYEGPLARIARLDELEGINDFLAVVFGVSQVNPEILDLYDFDQIGEDLVNITGTSQKYLRPLAERQAIREQRAQQQALIAQQQALMTGGQVAKDVGAASQSLAAAEGANNAQAA